MWLPLCNHIPGQAAHRLREHYLVTPSLMWYSRHSDIRASSFRFTRWGVWGEQGGQRWDVGARQRKGKGGERFSGHPSGLPACCCSPSPLAELSTSLLPLTLNHLQGSLTPPQLSHSRGPQMVPTHLCPPTQAGNPFQAPFLQRHLRPPVSLTETLASTHPRLCFPCTPSVPRSQHFFLHNVLPLLETTEGTGLGIGTSHLLFLLEFLRTIDYFYNCNSKMKSISSIPKQIK